MVYQRSWSYAILFLRYGSKQMQLFSIWVTSSPFTPLTAWKIKIKKENEKLSWRYHHVCTKWCTIMYVPNGVPKYHVHMLYCSWDMVGDRCNCYFPFWAIFCPFTPLTAQKIKFLKKWKKVPGDIIILHKCTTNYDQILYSSWDMVCNRRTDRWMEKVKYRGGCCA